MHDAFNRNSGSYQSFGVYFLAWDHLYLTYCSPCSFLWVLRYHPLDILGVKWMEPQHSILDSLDLVYLAGIKQDFNAHRDFEKNCQTGRNSNSNTQSDYSNMSTISRNLGVSQITTS